MDIKGFIDTSFVDWDGEVASVVFTPGCNFKCPYCYNHELVFDPQGYPNVPRDHIFSFLDEHADFIDGVVIIGGEPTIHPGLVEFCRSLKDKGLKVKLDTNGTNPDIMKELLDENLVDYVAMDVKAPLNQDKYSRVVGKKVNGEVAKIKETIQVVISSGVDHEFRTTVVPTFHETQDIEDIAKTLKDANRYVLQKYAPLNIRGDSLDGIPSPSDEEMEDLATAARQYVETVKWRGK